MYIAGCKYYFGYKDNNIKYYHDIILNKNLVWEPIGTKLRLDHNALTFGSLELAEKFIEDNKLKFPLIKRIEV